MNPGNSAQLTGTDQLAYDIEAAPGPDAFDNWCAERDAHEAHLASAQALFQAHLDRVRRPGRLRRLAGDG